MILSSQRLWTILERMAVLAMLVASGVVIWSGLNRQPASAQLQQPQLAQDIDGVLSIDMIRDAASEGNANAHLAIVEFGDYQCPYCARHESEVQPEIRREFIERGEAKFVFLNLPLDMHQFARKAAEAAECARTQGKYSDMHSHLFENQRALKEADLVKYAHDLGLELAKFEDCMKKGFSDRIDKQAAVARRFGISATPAFLIGEVQPDGSVRLRKKINGAVPYVAFESILKSLQG
jgi:protein-disulfide isomerase